MKNEFIPYEQSVKLKELGFDEPCIAFYEPGNKQVQVVGVEQRYNNPELLRMEDFCAPLYQQAFRWFREKHGLVGIIKFGTNDFTYNVYNEDGMGLLTKESLNFNSTYEEAELECLKKLIEIVNTKEK
jgi:hypothetical protein